MTHNIARLSLVLLLVTTSIALLRLSETLGSDARLSSPQQTIQAVRRYYASVNQFLVTGDLDEMASVAGASELDVLPEVGAFGEGSELATYLLALRSSNPGLRFVVDDIESSGEIAIARVSRAGAQTADTESSDAAGVSSSEYFRVREGRIIEHWRAASPLTSVHDVIAEDSMVRIDRPGQLVMADLSFWPNENRYVAIPGPGIVIVTGGALELVGNGLTEVVDLESGRRQTTASGSSLVVTTGQAIFIPRRQAVLRNVFPENASARIVVVASDEQEITAGGGDRVHEADGTSGFSHALLGTSETVIGAAGVVIHPVITSTIRIEPGWQTFAFGWTLIDPGGRYQIAGGELSVTATIAGSVTNMEEGASPFSRRMLSNDGNRPALVLIARVGPGS